MPELRLLMQLQLILLVYMHYDVVFSYTIMHYFIHRSLASFSAQDGWCSLNVSLFYILFILTLQ